MTSPNLSDDIQALLANLPSLGSMSHPERVDTLLQVFSPRFGSDLDEASISDEEISSPPLAAPGSAPKFFTLPLDMGRHTDVLDNGAAEVGSGNEEFNLRSGDARSWLAPAVSSMKVLPGDNPASLAVPSTIFCPVASSFDSSPVQNVSAAASVMSPMRQQLCAHPLPSADVGNMSLGSEEAAADSSQYAEAETPFGCGMRSSHTTAAKYIVYCPESPLRQQMREHPPPNDESEPEGTPLCFPSRGELPLRCEMHTQRSVGTHPSPRSPVAPYHLVAGGCASLTGLKARHELNGAIAKLLYQLEDSDDADSRWMVVLDDGLELAVRTTNLLAFSPAQLHTWHGSSVPTSPGGSSQRSGSSRSLSPRCASSAWLEMPATPSMPVVKAAPCIGLEPGSKVRVVCLRGRAELNGRMGVVLETVSSKLSKKAFSEQWLVALDGSSAEELVLSATNLEALDHTPFAKAPKTTPASVRASAAPHATRGQLPLTTIVLLSFVALGIGIFVGAGSQVQVQEAVEEPDLCTCKP